MKFIYTRLILFFLFIFTFTFKSYSQAPVASFTVADPNGCAPFIGATFDASGSTNNPTTYSWDFGDGTVPTTLSTPIVQHNYSIPGSYTVTLIAANGSGASAPYTFPGVITVFALPTAGFTTDVDTACSGIPVNFSDASIPGDGAINFYSWYFMDGSPADSTSGVNAAHIYNNSSMNYTYYIPMYYVRDVNGCISSVTQTPIYVTPIDSVCTTIGLNDLILESYSSYPNPTSNNFTIENKNGIAINQVVIYNLAGTKMKDIVYKGGDNKITIQTEEFSPGIYIIECHFDSGMARMKMTKL